jgi:hypothetical protein
VSFVEQTNLVLKSICGDPALVKIVTFTLGAGEGRGCSSVLARSTCGADVAGDAGSEADVCPPLTQFTFLMKDMGI